MRWKMKNEIACHCERELPGAFCVCAYLRFFLLVWCNCYLSCWNSSQIPRMCIQKRPATAMTRLIQRGATLSHLPPLTTCSVQGAPGPINQWRSHSVHHCEIWVIPKYGHLPKKTRGEKTCRITHQANFVFHDGVKINTLAFHQMQKAGIYLVSSNFGFIVQYLKMNLFRFLRGTLVKKHLSERCCFRKVIVQSTHNVSGTTSRRLFMPWPADHQAVLRHFPWPLDRPSLSWSLLMIHLCFLHLELRRRYPSMAMSENTEFALWACQNSCRSWQTQKFVLQGPRRMHWCKQRKSENPSEESNSWAAACDWPSLSPRGIAAHGHIVNGATKDKVSIMTLPQVKPHLLIHDDASQFETHIKRQSTSNAVKKAFNSIKCYAVDEFHRANRTCSRKNSPNERSRSYAMFRPCLRPSTPGSARKILNSMTLWIASVIDSGCRSPSGFGIAAWRPCPSKSPGDQRLQHVSAKQANRHRDVRLPDLAAGIGQQKPKKRKKKQKTHVQKTFQAQSQDEPYISSKNCVFWVLGLHIQ